MTLFLLLSCGSGTTSAEDSQGRFLKSVISLSNDFLNVFTSLSGMVGGGLGFNTTTKKSDVENYFKTIEKSLTTTKTSLEKIVDDMKSENNPNAEATDTAVKKLVSEILNKIIEGAKTASEVIGDAGDPIGNVGANNAAGVVGTEVDKLVKGIKDIVAVVLKEGNPEAGDDKKAENLSARTGSNATDGEAGKLFAIANAGNADNAKKSAADAAKAIVKNGKFAGSSAQADDAVTAVNGAAISAVTKALGTLTIAIRETIDAGLKTVKDAMKINSTDTLLTTDNQTP
ncbi:variable large family protein [Borrelia puertoricensis]|uniref:variable large family protein n=1 Tax=Borrelia puertoricensis TaxID=2756107 RepID=UPI001FF6B820|nr:variable large family protein [Borrelia puertoricensis]UPA19048.1 variable large family protein [Borrelia puertoricensis]